MFIPIAWESKNFQSFKQEWWFKIGFLLEVRFINVKPVSLALTRYHDVILPPLFEWVRKVNSWDGRVWVGT